MGEDVNAKESSLVVRSMNDDRQALVRFINTTRREIDILWVNYEGQAVSYGTLAAGKYRDVRTYVTHPWIFVDFQTLERFVVRGKDVFYPMPWVPRPGNPRSTRPTPHLVPITIPMYSLRRIAIRAIKSLLRDDNDAYLLEIPTNLQHELASATPKKNRSSS